MMLKQVYFRMRCPRRFISIFSLVVISLLMCSCMANYKQFRLDLNTNQVQSEVYYDASKMSNDKDLLLGYINDNFQLDSSHIESIFSNYLSLVEFEYQSLELTEFCVLNMQSDNTVYLFTGTLNGKGVTPKNPIEDIQLNDPRDYKFNVAGKCEIVKGKISNLVIASSNPLVNNFKGSEIH